MQGFVSTSARTNVRTYVSTKHAASLFYETACKHEPSTYVPSSSDPGDRNLADSWCLPAFCKSVSEQGQWMSSCAGVLKPVIQRSSSAVKLLQEGQIAMEAGREEGREGRNEG